MKIKVPKNAKKGYYKSDKEKELFSIVEIGEENCIYVWADGCPGMASLKQIVIVEEKK